MRARLWLSAAVLVALVCAPATLSAHDPALSGIRILMRPDDVVVVVSTHLSRLKQAAHVTGEMPAADIDRAIGDRLRLRIDGVTFMPGTGHVINDPANDLLIWQAVKPGAASVVEVLSRVYPDEAASRTVVSVVRDGQVAEESLLDAKHPSYLRAQPALSLPALAGRYVTQGIEHILGGPDHVLFVIGLLLLGQSLWGVLRTITAFTLAHSLTLTVAALGLFTPPSRVVEPLIALSIVAIAIENLRSRSARGGRDYRPGVACLFGLVHGFGFAGALTDAGLSARALWLALGSFNLGVEIGQASIVLAAAPVIAWLSARHARQWRTAMVAASVAIGLCGSYWFAVRLWPAA